MDDLRNSGEAGRTDGAKPGEDAAAAGSATGVFGVVAGPPGSAAAVGQDAAARVAPVPPVPPPVAQLTPVPAALVQPIVHRVVVGGDASGKASDYDELLNRLRAGGVSNAAAADRKGAAAGDTKPASATPADTTGTPAVALPPAAPSNVGFSQLLRTLEVEPPAPVAKPVATEGLGRVTPVPEPQAELRKIEVQTIDLRAPIPAAGIDALLRTPAEKLPEVMPEAVVAPEPVPSPAAASAPAQTLSAGGFTELLRRGSGEALDFGQAGSRTPVESSMQKPVTTPQSPTPSAPVSFTQMFRALDAKAEDASVKSGFTPLADAPAPPSIAPPEPVADSPGSFTQMFRMSETKAEVTPSEPVFTPPAPAAPAPAAASPGSFTQMFRALDAKVEDKPVGSGFAPPAVQTPPPASSPGTFTQLFRTLDSAGSAPAPTAPVARMEPPPVAPPQKDAGSFTQMLSVQRPSDAPAYAPPQERQRAAPNPGAWDAVPAQGGGTNWPAGGSGGFGESPVREPERRPEPVGGGLTQLLRTLDGPSSAPPAWRDEAPPMPPPAAGPGMFTQTYQRLEGREQAGQAAAPVPVPSAPGPSGATGFNQPAMPIPPPPAASGGPSEFTRILDASRMREMGLRSGGGETPGMPPAQAGSVAAPSMPQMAPPMMPQPMMPQMPQQGMPPGAGYPMPPAGYPGGMPAYGAPPMAAPQMAPPAMPAAPALQPPQVAPPAAGAIPKYLPMILIGVIFVLVVVVIALVFLMKH